MNKKRLITSVLLGAFLGIFCIIGVGMRVGYSGNWLFLIAMWYNRVVMGFVIGIMKDFKVAKGSWNEVIRGALVGIIISSTIFVSSEFRDIPAFFAGVVYGIIIDTIASKLSRK
jgi:hypothetical protein